MTHDQIIDVIRAELFIAIPVFFLLTVYALRLALRHRPLWAPWILFVACVLAGADATWLFGASWYNDNIGPLPEWALIVTAVVTSVNAHLPFVVIAYSAVRAFRG